MAIADSDNDTVFDCLAANRTGIDYEKQVSTYVWTFQGADGSSKREVWFTVMPGPTPGTLNFFMENECLLWVRRRLKDTVPQVCIDNFVDTCGVVIKPGRRDLCDDGEGDY
ncbi:hypothetical protein MTO96_051232 [Rhipicephalus appendiculatus]